LVKRLPASPLLQTHARRPDKRAANGARGLVGLLMIALSSLAFFPRRLNLIMNAGVPASLVRGMTFPLFRRHALAALFHATAEIGSAGAAGPVTSKSAEEDPAQRQNAKRLPRAI
jgi:hypothetical protein